MPFAEPVHKLVACAFRQNLRMEIAACGMKPRPGFRDQQQ
jgi:hypothetical protein